jgi:hypothetical protein
MSKRREASEARPPRVPLEREVVRDVRDLIKAHGGRMIKVRGDVHLVNEPDLVGCLAGRMLAIECKRPGERPSPGQYARLRVWANTGALAFWADSAAYVEEILRREGLI